MFGGFASLSYSSFWPSCCSSSAQALEEHRLGFWATPSRASARRSTDEEAEAAAAAKAQGDPNVIEGEVASQASQKEDSQQQSANQQSRV